MLNILNDSKLTIASAKAHLSKDPHFEPLIKSIDLPDFSPSGQVYVELIESIVSQQLSVKAAATIFGRFLELFPDKYPEPNAVTAMNPESLRAVGLSYQKAGYIQNVARFALQNNMENHNWHELSDEEIIAHLTTIKGVGKWTTEMILMFTLGRWDVMPIDDLGIQQGMTKLIGITETGKELKKKMIELSIPWKPYRSIACRYLWRWKDS